MAKPRENKWQIITQNYSRCGRGKMTEVLQGKLQILQQFCIVSDNGVAPNKPLGNKPFSKPMIDLFTDANMRRSVSFI